MAQSMRKSSNDPSFSKSKSKRIQIRSMPGTTDPNQTVARSADPSISLKYTQKISQRKLLFTRSLLRSQVCAVVYLFSWFKFYFSQNFRLNN